jgi:hypothetical protein
MLLNLIDEHRARDAYGRLWIRKEDRWEQSPLAGSGPVLVHFREPDRRVGSTRAANTLDGSPERRS